VVPLRGPSKPGTKRTRPQFPDVTVLL